MFQSRYEPFGTVIVDAWAANRPLIAAAAAGPKAYLKHEENGLLVAIDDVESLAHAIHRLIEDEAMRAKIIEGGTRSYTDQFTKEAFVRDSLNFYQKVRKSE